MRPNIDIPWRSHGVVHDYADERDISVDEAYIQFIDRVEESLTPDHDGEGMRIPLAESPPDTDVPIPTSGGGDQITICTAQPQSALRKYIGGMAQPVRVRGAQAGTMDEMVDMCERVAPYLEHDERSGIYAISCEDEVHMGVRMDTYLETVRSVSHEDTSATGISGMYVAPMGRPEPHPKYVVITTGMWNGDAVADAGYARMSVIMSGHPVGRNGRWSEMVDRTGTIDETAHDEPIERVPIDTTDVEPTIVKPVPQMTPSQYGDEKRVSHYLIENPWYDDNQSIRDDTPNGSPLGYQGGPTITHMEHMMASMDRPRDPDRVDEYLYDGLEVLIMHDINDTIVDVQPRLSSLPLA